MRTQICALHTPRYPLVYFGTTNPHLRQARWCLFDIYKGDKGKLSYCWPRTRVGGICTPACKGNVLFLKDLKCTSNGICRMNGIKMHKFLFTLRVFSATMQLFYSLTFSWWGQEMKFPFTQRLLWNILLKWNLQTYLHPNGGYWHLYRCISISCYFWKVPHLTHGHYVGQLPWRRRRTAPPSLWKLCWDEQHIPSISTVTHMNENPYIFSLLWS